MLKSNPQLSISQEDIVDYWALFRELPESYLLLKADDPAYTIVELNKAREQLTKVSREACIGKPCFEVYPDTTEPFQKWGVSETRERFRKAIRTGKMQSTYMYRYDLANEQGVLEQRYWQSMYIPVRLQSRRITHILAVTKDMTEEHRAENRIADTEDRLKAALSIGKIGSWVWNVTRDVVVGDKNLARVFGLERELVLKGDSLEKFVASIHPQDQERVRESIARTVAERTPFDEEYRTVTTDGRVRWVLARGKIEKQGSEVFFPGVIVDITERRDLQAQVELARRQDQLNRRESKILQKRNEELETISRTKDEFVALASHQLRTPATAVKQYLGMVMQGYVGEITPLQAEMLQKAFESNERQIQIINQILNAARADTGRLVMTTMPMDLRALTQGIATDMRSFLEQRQQTFIVDLPEDPVTILADLGYLRMAIENIVHNASIYTPEGGAITVRLETVDDQARISITDTGVGIKKADFGKLFTKFSRIHNPLSVQAGGSGIGLYLTAEIVRLHGGSIEVASKIRKGTTFAILLPLAHNVTKAEQTKIPVIKSRFRA